MEELSNLVATEYPPFTNTVTFAKGALRGEVKEGGEGDV